MKPKVRKEDPASRRRIAGIIMLLALSVVAVFFVGLLRKPSSDRWKEYAVIADSIDKANRAARQWAAKTNEKSNQPKDWKDRPFRVLSIELNGADSAMLCRVYGIGPVFSRRIIEYRQRLGGYSDLSQLTEVKGITQEVFDRISANFWIDSSLIQKIGVNFATRERLLRHPYVTSNMASRITKGSVMRGGYTTLKELIDSDILFPKEARRLAPYLSFETVPAKGATNN